MNDFHNHYSEETKHDIPDIRSLLDLSKQLEDKYNHRFEK